MRHTRLIIAAALGGAIAATAVVAQSDDTKRVRITYQNLTPGQGFAPSVFMSHNAGAPKLYAMGGKASFGLAQLAETGNVGPVVAGTAAATVAVATLIAIAVTGDDEPPTAAGGDRSSTDTDDGSDRDDPTGPGGPTPGGRLPAPRTADEPALRVASPMLAEPVTLVDAAAHTAEDQEVAGACVVREDFADGFAEVGAVLVWILSDFDAEFGVAGPSVV